MHIIPGQAGSGGAIASIAAAGKRGAEREVSLRHLLLVDDEADGAELAAILLRSHGLRVTVVHSAPAALTVLASKPDIEAVLADVIMPGMSGLQLAEIVRSTYPAIKIVLMSGYSSLDTPAMRKQAYLFARKPCRIDTIIALLNS